MPRNHPILPFLAASLGVAVFSAMDAAMKQASILAGVYSALLIRSFIASRQRKKNAFFGGSFANRIIQGGRQTSAKAEVGDITFFCNGHHVIDGVNNA